MRVPLQYKQMVAMGGVPDACDCRGRSELGGSSVGDDRCTGEGHGEYESIMFDLYGAVTPCLITAIRNPSYRRIFDETDHLRECIGKKDHL
jgi:hypothetical protein